MVWKIYAPFHDIDNVTKSRFRVWINHNKLFDFHRLRLKRTTAVNWRAQSNQSKVCLANWSQKYSTLGIIIPAAYRVQMRFAGMWGQLRPAICLTNKHIKYSNFCSERLHKIIKLLDSSWLLMHFHLENSHFDCLGLVDAILTRQNGHDTRCHSNRGHTWR